MTLPKVIGIAGYMGHGKDTVADVLVEHFEYTKIRMADELKRVVSEVYDLPLDKLNDAEFKATPHENLDGKTPRFALQIFGTEVCRTITPNTWVYCVDRLIESRPNENFVIPDVRFSNEADLVFKHDGMLVGVKRYPKVRTIRNTFTQYFPQLFLHQSERQVPYLLKLADKVFDNNSSLDQLQSEVLTFFKEIFEYHVQ